MKPIIFNPASEEEWLKLKKEDISSTEISALYGYSPYDTEYGLYFEKRGEVEADKEKLRANFSRAFWGKIYEERTAQVIGELYGVTVEKMPGYIRHGSVRRMGSSFDYKITGLVDNWKPSAAKEIEELSVLRDRFIKSGPGILEIKIVDRNIFAKTWQDGEAPIHIEFQVQQQMEVAADYSWTAIAASVIGERIHFILRDRDEALGAKMCKRVQKFWSLVDAGTPPKPNFARDSEIISKLYSNQADDAALLDFGTDTKFHNLCRKALRANQLIKKLEDIESAAKAELKTLVGENGGGASVYFKLTMSKVKESAPTLITPAMVGTTYGGRKGYRMMKIKQLT